MSGRVEKASRSASSPKRSVGPTTTPTRPSPLSLRACSQADCGDENRKRIDADRIKMAPTIVGATGCLPMGGRGRGSEAYTLVRQVVGIALLLPAQRK